MSTDFYIPQTQESIVARRQFIIENFSCPAPTELSDEKLEDLSDRPISPWCNSARKRIFDLVCVVPALILISPLLALLAVAVRCTSKGPIIFRQQRAGQHRKLFVIYKFRTMVQNSEAIGPDHTSKDDPRITPVGKILRRFKLDELPQLYNVLLGDMSLVGPRPKLPHHDNTSMNCRPGVTGAATLAFLHEQHILCEVPQERLEEFYQEHVVPLKLLLDAKYQSRATFFSDLRIVVATLLRTETSLSFRDFFYSPDRQVENKPPNAAVVLQNN